jgi:hypothetical protein
MNSQDITTLIETSQEKLRTKIQEFTTEGITRARKQALETEIDGIKNEIAKLKEWSTALEIKPSHDLRRKAIEKATLNFKTKFKLKDDCIIFWEQFREYVVQHYTKVEIPHVLLPLWKSLMPGNF